MIKEGLLWSFNVCINELGELVLIKKNVKIDDLRKLESEELPIVELTSVLEYLHEMGIIIEESLTKICKT